VREEYRVGPNFKRTFFRTAFAARSDAGKANLILRLGISNFNRAEYSRSSHRIPLRIQPGMESQVPLFMEDVPRNIRSMERDTTIAAQIEAAVPNDCGTTWLGDRFAEVAG